MQDSTLFLLQADFKQASQLLQQLQQMAEKTDPVVLMAESTLLLDHPDLQSYPLYILNTEAELLTLTVPESVTVLDYSQFTDLLLQYQRCISLK